MEISSGNNMGSYEKLDLMINLKATELRLGLPGTHESDHHHHDNDHQSSSTDHAVMINISNKKRPLPSSDQKISEAQQQQQETAPPAKAQIVGWPPVRAHRKNSLMMSQQMMKKSSTGGDSEAEISGMFVKVSMDGAPYLRKIDLRVYNNYPQLLKALEGMFKFTLGEYSEREGYKGSEFVPTYEDKDGDWMLVGDVPWDMFMSSCKRMRIMRESEARGLGCGV
uniref:Auxin-responsive protein n=1 Tax=Boehmeria nivea TaxID=83906 RepID=A0A172J1U6_BOENI|nr:Aux/IAA transcription factor [Boehmeria nivea]